MLLSTHQVVLLILVEREREDGKRLKRRRVAHFFISCFGEPIKLLFQGHSLKSFIGKRIKLLDLVDLTQKRCQR